MGGWVGWSGWVGMIEGVKCFGGIGDQSCFKLVNERTREGFLDGLKMDWGITRG